MTIKKKTANALVRSSAAEYLTFVAASGTSGVEAIYADENVWLSQKMMAQLFDVQVPTINYRLKRCTRTANWMRAQLFEVFK